MEWVLLVLSLSLSLSLALSLSLSHFVLGVFLLHIFVTEVFLRLGVGVTFSGSADVEV